ncbi:hypothetical protein Tco_1430649 [Tanacetum coccineum]
MLLFISMGWHSTMPKPKQTVGFQDVFETPLPLAPAASAENQALADWNALFDRSQEVFCLMLGTMSPKLNPAILKQISSEMITELQKDSWKKPPGYQLATLNYAFPDKVSISFILNSLSSEFQAFVQNYNMQSMEKTISEVHSLLIEFEKSIKRNKQQIVGASSTPHVMAIQSGRVQKNKKPQGKAKRKEKVDERKKLEVINVASTASGLKRSKEAEAVVVSTCTWNGLARRTSRKLLRNLTTLPFSFWDYALESAARILNMVPTKKHMLKRHTPDKLQQRSVKCIFVGYPKETIGYYFYYLPENKIVVERYADFLEKDFILQKESGRNVELDNEDILPSENTSEHILRKKVLSPDCLSRRDVRIPFEDL